MRITATGRLARAALAAVVVAGALVVPLGSAASADPAPVVERVVDLYEQPVRWAEQPTPNLAETKHPT